MQRPHVPRSSPTSRRWCFTENDPHMIETLIAYFGEERPSLVRYCVFQLEEVDHTHLQGYVELTSPRKLTWLKANISSTAHWEISRGSRDEARNYCMKEDSRVDGPWEYGEFTAGGQGKRNDLSDACALIASGATRKQLAEQYPTEFVKFHRGLDYLNRTLHPLICTPKYKLEQFREDPVDLSKTCVILGPSGIGKTAFALAHFEKPLLVTHMDTLGEFDGSIHDGIVFDDMSFTHLHCEARIHIVDQEYGRDIHIRYTTVRIPSYTKKIICHNGQPHPLIDDKLQGYQLEAVRRRINEYTFYRQMFSLPSPDPSSDEEEEE